MSSKRDGQGRTPHVRIRFKCQTASNFAGLHCRPIGITVIFSSRPFSGSNAFVLALVAAVCLALALQGAHVCAPAESSAAGFSAATLLAAPMCQVCALANTLLTTLLLILFPLVPTQTRAVPVFVQVRSYWRGLRLDLRAPPVL